MKIKRKELLDVLLKLRPGLDVREIVEQSNSFVFVEGEIITFNDEVSVSCLYDLGFEGAVDANTFIQYLQRVKKEEIEFTIRDNELRIKDSGKATIALQDIKMPIDDIPAPKDNDWKKLPSDFIEAIDFAAFTASNDFSLAILTNLYIKGKRILSSDRYRITRYDMKKGIKGEMLLPANVVKHIKSYKSTKYCAMDGWLHFMNDNDIVLSVRTYEDEYPVDDIESSIVIDGNEVVFPEETKDLIEKAEVFIDVKFEQDKKVGFEFADGKMKVASTSNHGSFEESVDVDVEDEFSFSANTAFMKQALPLLNKALISDMAITIQGSNFVHTICLK